MVTRVHWLPWMTVEGKAPTLGVVRLSYQPPTPAHTHDFSELVLILGGRGMHVTGGEKYPISAGDVFVISDSQAHSYADTENLSLVNVFFDARRLHLPKYDVERIPGFHVLMTLEPRFRKRHTFSSRLRLSPEDLATAEAILDPLERELSEHKAGCLFVATALFMQLLAHLSRCYASPQTQPTRSLLRLGEIISYLEANYAEPISRRSLAKAAHMSERTLARNFRKRTSFSPIDYLIRLRITKACELLRHSDDKIISIAQRVGFSDSSYFWRQFRKVMGQSPREFRKHAGAQLSQRTE